MEKNVFYFDGASKGNPGEAGSACVYVKNGNIIRSDMIYLGKATNNEAEYNALILALKISISLNIENPIFKGDSLLVINQVTNKWQTHSKNLAVLQQTAVKLLENIKNYKLMHVKRKFNKLADKGANDILLVKNKEKNVIIRKIY